MNNRLEEIFFESFRKISNLQKDIEKEDKNTFFEDAERRRFDLIGEYLQVGEYKKAIFMLGKFLEDNEAHLSFGRSMLTLQMFSTLLVLMSQSGFTQNIDKYLDMFNKCAGNMNEGYLTGFKESVQTYGAAITAIIRKETDKYETAIENLKKLESLYETESDSLPLAFHISILEYQSNCYRNMGDYDNAIGALMKALALEQSTELIIRRMTSLEKISLLYELKNEYKLALQYYNSFCELNNEVYTTKNYAYSQFLIELYGLSKQEIQTDMLIEGNRDLSDRVLRDGLTGIYNRRFLHKLTDESFMSGRVWGVWGAIMFDIDYFKNYNDNYGHLAGDNVLVTFGNILKIYETSNIFPVRYGGEEFLLVVRAATLNELRLLAEQVVGQLRAFSIMHLYSPIANIVTVSAGYSVLSCKDHDDFERLIKESDSALYQAKQEGRNQIMEFRR